MIGHRPAVWDIAAYRARTWAFSEMATADGVVSDILNVQRLALIPSDHQGRTI